MFLLNRSMHILCDCHFFIKGNEPHYSTCRMVLEKKKHEYKNGLPRNPDGSLRLQNQYLASFDEDILYHLGMGTKTQNLKALFGDVKFICMGGTSQRMKLIGEMAIQELGIEIPAGCDLVDMTASTYRYALYKVGPLICVNHGIGMASLGVVLQEVIKLLQYAGVKDPTMFRIGTSGGIGLKPGTVVVTENGYNGLLEETYNLPVLGEMVKYPVKFDKRLAEELHSLSHKDDHFEIVTGGTLGAEDFYNGQGRTDGPFCEYTEEDKFAYLKKLHQKNIKNVEMETTCFGSMTHRAGIKAAAVCVTIVNRFDGDQVTIPKSVILEHQKHPIIVVLRYIKEYLKSVGRYPYGVAS